MKGFISYAHKDKIYFDLLLEGIKSHSSVNDDIIQLELWSDNAITIGASWHNTIQDKLKESDFAILLLSAHFFASSYIKKFELSEFLKRKKKEGYLIFPILISDFDYFKFGNVSKYQFFAAWGEDYGVEGFEGKITPYNTLTQADSKGLPNPLLSTYHKNLVIAIKEAIQKHNAKKYNPRKRKRIQDTYDIPTQLEMTDFLEEKIRALTFKNPIIKDLHRVNCDRVNQIGKFYTFFEKNRDRPFQIYPIIGDDIHQPESFAERLVYELEENLSDEGFTLHYKSNASNGIIKQRVNMHAEPKAKRDFQLGFSKMASPAESSTQFIRNLSEFLNSNSPTLQYDYLVVVFKIDAYYYPNGYSFDQFLDWIRTDFCNIDHSPKTKIIFLLVFSLSDNSKQKIKNKFYKSLKQFAANGKKNTLLVHKFSEVGRSDLERWFREQRIPQMKARSYVREIIDLLDKNFPDEYVDQYLNKQGKEEKLQMEYVQMILNIICKTHE